MNSLLGMTRRYAGGGIVPPYKYRGGGAVGSTDTVPAMLTPGEVVLNAGQQQRLGAVAGVPSGALFNAAGVPGFQGGGEVPDFYNQILSNITAASEQYPSPGVDTSLYRRAGKEGTVGEGKQFIDNRKMAKAFGDYAKKMGYEGRSGRKMSKAYTGALDEYLYSGSTNLDETFFDEYGDPNYKYKDLVARTMEAGIPLGKISKRVEGPLAYSPKIVKHGPYNPENPMSPMMWTDESGKRWVDPYHISSTFDYPEMMESYYEKGIPYVSSLIGPLGGTLETGSPASRIRSNLANLIPYEEYKPEPKGFQYGGMVPDFLLNLLPTYGLLPESVKKNVSNTITNLMKPKVAKLWEQRPEAKEERIKELTKLSKQGNTPEGHMQIQSELEQLLGGQGDVREGRKKYPGFSYQQGGMVPEFEVAEPVSTAHNAMDNLMMQNEMNRIAQENQQYGAMYNYDPYADPLSSEFSEEMINNMAGGLPLKGLNLLGYIGKRFGGKGAIQLGKSGKLIDFMKKNISSELKTARETLTDLNKVLNKKYVGDSRAALEKYFPKEYGKQFSIKIGKNLTTGKSIGPQTIYGTGPTYRAVENLYDETAIKSMNLRDLQRMIQEYSKHGYAKPMATSYLK